MNIKWNGLLVLCLLLLCVFGLVSSNDDVTIECVAGCKIKDNNIYGKDGGTIKLHLTFAASKVIILSYDEKRILTAVPVVPMVSVDKGSDPRFKPGNLPQKTIGNVVLPITFTNISLSKDNEKSLSYKLTQGSVVHNGSMVLNIFAPPKLCGNDTLETFVAKRYTAVENGNTTIDFKLCGNPAPKVTANIDGKEFTVVHKETDERYSFEYITSLGGITHNECGKTMKFLIMKNSSISPSTIIDVKFTPAEVENITAKLDRKDCLSVKWKKVEAGNCAVHYELKYMMNGTFKTIPLNQELEWKTCNSSINNTVNVRAIYANMYGNFNEKAIKPKAPPQPVTKPPTTTTATLVPSNPSVKEGETTMHWKYILAIVVGVIALLLIIAVVVIASRRKKSKGDNNNGQLEILRNPAEESDYAEVNSLRSVQTNKEPPDENHMVYAELGPGGGRTGPKPAPEESNYARVKTEGLYYPPLQQSFREPAKKPFYEPPKYSVASRSKKDIPPRSSLIGDDDDYVEDILV